MAAILPSLDSPEERLVFWAIVGTWGLYILGALYHVYPLLGWTLVALALGRRIGVIDDFGHASPKLPWGVIAWLIGMATMAISLTLAHINFDLEFGQFVKSLLGWVKGWGLMGAFIFAGADLRIKQIVIFRASNILALQTLMLTPLLAAIALAGAPNVLYVSPLYYLGGTGPMFFEVGSHTADANALGFRLHYFAPWSPAAAFCAHIGLVCGMFDRSRRWRWIGIFTALVVCAMSQSRLSLIAVPVLLVGLPLLSNVLRTWPAAVAATLATVSMLVLTQIKDGLNDATQAFINARADSSRVRSALARIAYHRWESEAPIFGHGAIERGSHLVEFMPIGSHHTWYGLLFVKGAVGFVALALPLAWSFFELLAKAQRDATARAALGMVLVLMFNSFGENLEILAYLAAPGLLAIGIASRHKLRTPRIWDDQLRPAFAVHPEFA
jgi:hypothetical protein